MNYNFVIHAIYSIALTMYKYNELQVFGATKNLSCEASYETFFFS